MTRPRRTTTTPMRPVKPADPVRAAQQAGAQRISAGVKQVASQTQKINPQTGKAYSVQPAQGGVFHTYADGRRVFVKAKPPAATGSAASAAAAQSAAPSDDPRDATYFADKASDDFQRTGRINELFAQDATEETQFNEALRRYREQLPRLQRNALVSANRAGLAESSTLQTTRMDNEVNAQRQEADMRGSYDAGRAARQVAREALQNGATIEEATRLAAAADRRQAYYTERADENSLASNQQAPPPQPAIQSAGGQGGSSQRNSRKPAGRKPRQTARFNPKSRRVNPDSMTASMGRRPVRRPRAR